MDSRRSFGLPESSLSIQLSGVLRALVEILVLSYLIYQVIRVVRGTRAAPVMLGVALVAGLYYASGALGLGTIEWLIGTASPYAAIALIVIFQAEIRRALRQMALTFLPMGRPSEAEKLEYEDVVFGVAQLSEEKVGALIVLERETGLLTFIQSGVPLGARLTSDLLVSIFQSGSPLHDGAVIISRGKVAAASCFLPLATQPELDSALGTRHRAAIGVTEESDCVAIVAAETTGRISLAVGGNLETNITLDRLRVRLIEHFGPVVLPPRGAAAPPAPPARTIGAERPAGETVRSVEGVQPTGVGDV